MIVKDRKKLLAKLNDYTIKTLELAAGFCITRAHYEVTIEHLLVKLLEEGNGDVTRILSHFQVDGDGLWKKLLGTLENLQSGNTGSPSFSPHLIQVFESAFLLAAIQHDLPKIRTGAILQALLAEEGYRLDEYRETFDKINIAELRRKFFEIVAGSAEDEPGTPADARKLAGLESPREGKSALDLYTVNFTALAAGGKLDPVFGRDVEIQQMVDILSRRRKNNPILVGEAGVGKTAIIEGLALRIAGKDVPAVLESVAVRGLDLGLLQAGAGGKGEFENRLKNVLNEVKQSGTPVILFIDEAHTLIGAGGAAGTGDAANLLKPALARGEMKTIAATTWAEYTKYFEKDAALTRRFQLVKVEEPPEELATVMLRGLKEKYEQHHRVHIEEEAITSAVKLSKRYIAGRQLPDKAVGLLDTAAARVKMGQTAKPSQLEYLERGLENFKRQLGSIKRDLEHGLSQNGEEASRLEAKIQELERKRNELAVRWQREKESVAKIIALRKNLAVSGRPAKEDDWKQLAALQDELKKTQGDEALIHETVNAGIVAQVVSDWTGIPLGKMIRDEARNLLNLETVLAQRIIGQDHVIQEIADVLRASKSGLRNPDSPLGVFLLVGPSGVGKTELARCIADVLFGGEQFLTTINMSEYQEKHTVSQLKGAPPGYVGYGEGGILTEAVRRKPYSVVLLDEAEKAHAEVLNLFYQAFDKGVMRDGQGRDIDFRNTVIMLTSNLGSSTIIQLCTEHQQLSVQEIERAIKPDLAKFFQAALLARMKVLPFVPLATEVMQGIVQLKLKKLAERLHETRRLELVYDETVTTAIVDRCTDITAGARNIDLVIDRVLLPEIAKSLLLQLSDERRFSQLKLAVKDDGEFAFTFA